MAELTNREITLALAGLGVGLVSGFAGGYFAVKKQMQVRYEQFAEDEIEEMRAHYRAKEQALDGRAAKDAATELIEELGYVPANAQVEIDQTPLVDEINARQAEEIQKNIFEEPEPEVEYPGWDYAVETKSRRRDRPYILHRDEYMQGEMEYEQSTLTYFDGDEVLCDERDSVIDNQEEMVGLENLQRFGHGSGDPNVLYVRNDTVKLDIEVIRSEGKYAHEVHGFDRVDQMPERARRDFDDDSP